METSVKRCILTMKGLTDLLNDLGVAVDNELDDSCVEGCFTDLATKADLVKNLNKITEEMNEFPPEMDVMEVRVSIEVVRVGEVVAETITKLSLKENNDG